jgi:hypothetical protein
MNTRPAIRFSLRASIPPDLIAESIGIANESILLSAFVSR